MVIGSQRLDPRDIDHVLHLVVVEVEPEPHGQRDHESAEHDDVGPPLDQGRLHRVDEEKHEHSGERPEGNDAQQISFEKVH